MINVNSKLPNQPMISSAGTNYDEECSQATMKVIQQYIGDLEVPEITDTATETVGILFSMEQTSAQWYKQHNRLSGSSK